MRLLLLHVSTAHEEWADEVEILYLRKLKAFFPFESKALRPRKASRADAQNKKEIESARILEEIASSDYVILFDEKGESLNSRGFAKKIEKALGSSRQRLVFIIGGAYGVSDEVRQRAHWTASLSSLTMNHLLAKTVALEQIYRSFTILRNLPYHND